MTEKDLEIKFTDFLLNEKGYPKNSLLKQVPTYSFKGIGVQPDLLLLDTAIGEYIGLIEFKASINPNIKHSVKFQITEYLKAIKAESLPTYLVVPFNGDEFQILVMDKENDWTPILIDDFPEFDSLSARKKIEEKAAAKELEEIIIKQNESKKEKSAKLSLWTLSSLILGIFAAIISVYITQKSNRLDEYTSKLNISNDLQKIENKILELEKQKVISSHVDTIVVIDSSKAFVGLEKRISIIEDGIINNSEKALTLNNLKQQIMLIQSELNHQKELEIIRNENLKAKIDWINALVIGMVLALFSAGIGFVITNYTNKKNTTANNV